MSPDILSVSVRSVGFALLFQAAGAAFFSALFAVPAASGEAVRLLARWGALFGAIAFTVHLALEASRMTGALSGLVDMGMQARVMRSALATSHVLQILGLLIVALASRFRDRSINGVAVIGAVMAVTGFLFVGHTTVGAWRALLAPLLAVHLLIVAFWFGSLLPMWVVSKRESKETSVAMLLRFSAIATWLVPVIAIAGIAMSVLIAQGIPSVGEPYGALLLAKLVGFGVLMVFAALNKWRLTPSMTGANQGSLSALRRSVLTEVVLIIAVLAVTSVMTTFYSPNE